MYLDMSKDVNSKLCCALVWSPDEKLVMSNFLGSVRAFHSVKTTQASHHHALNVTTWGSR